MPKAFWGHHANTPGSRYLQKRPRSAAGCRGGRAWGGAGRAQTQDWAEEVAPADRPGLALKSRCQKAAFLGTVSLLVRVLTTCLPVPKRTFKTKHLTTQLPRVLAHSGSMNSAPTGPEDRSVGLLFPQGPLPRRPCPLGGSHCHLAGGVQASASDFACPVGSRPCLAGGPAVPTTQKKARRGNPASAQAKSPV